MIRQPQQHPASWWDQFQQVSDRFDLGSLTESLGDEIVAKIPSPLLRREAEIALNIMVRFLNKPASEELSVRAEQAVARLAATVDRLEERSSDGFELREARALIYLLQGRTGDAAHAAEPFLKPQVILRSFVAALRLERFDTNLAVKLLSAGQDPRLALHSGQVVGKYSWWPSWLLKVVTERAMAGELDDDTITALDRCAYAELSPAQARLARRLLDGEESLIDASAVRLAGLGEGDAAAKLRKGDLTTVALAARLMPI
ncbi:hypothetical protein [Actinoplanes awajinensis]|uniref:Uncharacterized protein n=1 Tax=Actinoplanes awajinensis subsp. mycoplanecinus TaxID=135947 RepID=A0A117MQE2_9ACTN|nr:hypothetical protein [Actinoplanes awajinensis]KUL30054.1 hypothetical protein ADL15_25800 [Actinoplanes awajinensis subsp. mycoplanecinus]